MQEVDFTEELRSAMAAVRVQTTWLGTRRRVTSEQKSQAAETFNADAEFTTFGKKIINTDHPAWKEMSKIKNRMIQYWRTMSLPFPEAGIRLILRKSIERFEETMNEFLADLRVAERGLKEHYDEIKLQAQERLGDLYDESDYPETLDGLFEVCWDFPNVEPPPYLQTASPALYRAECERIQERFSEAVRLAEEAFIAEFNTLVSHLADKLTGTDDGKPKIFRDSAVTNLNEFFDRFESLNIKSNEELDRLVRDAKQVVSGVTAVELRKDGSIRDTVAEQLGTVRSALDGLTIERPKRNLIRKRGNDGPGDQA